MNVDVQLLAILTGHFLGHFVLQNDNIDQKKTTSLCWTAAHALSVSVITWLLLGSWDAWHMVFLIFLFHFAIDCFKPRLSDIFVAKISSIFYVRDQVQTGNIATPTDSSTLSNDKAKQPTGTISEKLQAWSPSADWDSILFMADQISHIMALLPLWLAFQHGWFELSLPTNDWASLWGIRYSKLLILISGFAVGVWGVGVLLKYQMASFAKHLPKDEGPGIPEGGRTIGILERVFVLIFVLAGKPEAAGFVMAAKSVFRIGDLTKNTDRKFAEYIMIGTLRSFAYAFVIAYTMKWLITNIK